MIRAYTPHQGEVLVFHGLPARRLRPRDPHWLKWITQTHPAEVEVRLPDRGSLVDPAGFLAELQLVASASGHRELAIRGRGTTWMYAAIGAAAARAGYERLVCFTPREQGGIVVLGRDTGELVQQPPVAQGLVLGIVGDPNSGKSVLANLLHGVAGQLGLSAWKLDCDAASPTPGWYLHLSAKDQQRAKLLRQQTKLGWTSQMERMLAEQLRCCRNRLALTLADLPGGDHRSNPPLRIPPGREVLFTEIDRFLVLGQQGTDAADAWSAELADRGWAGRVIAFLESRSPHEQCRVEWSSVEGPWRGLVQGLDRSLEVPSAIRLTNAQLQPFLHHILRTRPAVAPAAG